MAITVQRCAAVPLAAERLAPVQPSGGTTRWPHLETLTFTLSEIEEGAGLLAQIVGNTVLSTVPVPVPPPPTALHKDNPKQLCCTPIRSTAQGPRPGARTSRGLQRRHDLGRVVSVYSSFTACTHDAVTATELIPRNAADFKSSCSSPGTSSRSIPNNNSWCHGRSNGAAACTGNSTLG